jgi:hypothetical protein
VTVPRRLRAALACLLAAAACTGDDGARFVDRTWPADPEFINGGECPASRHDDLPDDAGCVSTVERAGERLVVYALLDRDAKPRSWRLRFDSGERETDRRLRAGNVTSYPRAIGATDLDSNGEPEWWVKVRDYASHGAAWAGLHLLVGDGDGGLAPVAYERQPLTVNFGGISRLGEGATCRDGDLVTLRVWARDRQNTRWWVSERRYAIDGGRATLVEKRRRSLVIESYADPDLARNYRVECDGQTFTPY